MFLSFPSETLEDSIAGTHHTYHVSGPWTVGHVFYMDLADGKCYLQDEMVKSDMVTQADIVKYKDIVAFCMR